MTLIDTNRSQNIPNESCLRLLVCYSKINSASKDDTQEKILRVVLLKSRLHWGFFCNMLFE